MSAEALSRAKARDRNLLRRFRPRLLRLALAIVVLVLLAVAAVLWGPGLAAPYIRSRLEALIAERLGRPVHIEGLDVSTLHGLRLEGLTAGDPAAPDLTIGALVLPWDLSGLPGRIAIGPVELSRPALRVRRDAAGATNLDGLALPAPATSSPDQPAATPLPPADDRLQLPLDIEFKGFGLEGGRIEIEDAASVLTLSLTDLALEVRPLTIARDGTTEHTAGLRLRGKLPGPEGRPCDLALDAELAPREGPAVLARLLDTVRPKLSLTLSPLALEPYATALRPAGLHEFQGTATLKLDLTPGDAHHDLVLEGELTGLKLGGPALGAAPRNHLEDSLQARLEAELAPQGRRLELRRLFLRTTALELEASGQVPDLQRPREGQARLALRADVPKLMSTLAGFLPLPEDLQAGGALDIALETASSGSLIQLSGRLQGQALSAVRGDQPPIQADIVITPRCSLALDTRELKIEELQVQAPFLTLAAKGQLAPPIAGERLPRRAEIEGRLEADLQKLQETLGGLLPKGLQLDGRLSTEVKAHRATADRLQIDLRDLVLETSAVRALAQAQAEIDGQGLPQRLALEATAEADLAQMASQFAAFLPQDLKLTTGRLDTRIAARQEADGPIQGELSLDLKDLAAHFPLRAQRDPSAGQEIRLAALSLRYPLHAERQGDQLRLGENLKLSLQGIELLGEKPLKLESLELEGLAGLDRRASELTLDLSQAKLRCDATELDIEAHVVERPEGSTIDARLEGPLHIAPLVQLLGDRLPPGLELAGDAPLVVRAQQTAQGLDLSGELDLSTLTGRHVLPPAAGSTAPATTIELAQGDVGPLRFEARRDAGGELRAQGTLKLGQDPVPWRLQLDAAGTKLEAGLETPQGLDAGRYLARISSLKDRGLKLRPSLELKLAYDLAGDTDPASPRKPLERLEAAGSLAIPALSYEDAKLEHLVLPFELSQGRLKPTRIAGRLNDGDFALDETTADLRGPEILAQTTVQAQGLRLSTRAWRALRYVNPLLPLLGQKLGGEARFDLSGTFRYAGRRTETIEGRAVELPDLNTLDAPAKLTLRDIHAGPGPLLTILSLARGEPGLSSYDLRAVTQTFVIKDGWALNEGLKTEGQDDASLDITGRTSLAGHLDQELHIERLCARNERLKRYPDLKLPVKLRGTVDAPSTDIEAAIQRALAEIFKREAEAALDEQKRKAAAAARKQAEEEAERLRRRAEDEARRALEKIFKK